MLPTTIVDLLNESDHACHNDKFRQGNIVCLPAGCTLIATGDIHGHRRNFERAAAFADLARNPKTHILLQEIIHGGPENELGGCLSYKLLFDVAKYKLAFPDNVHIIMGNHDTAFITDSQVLKNGKEMNRSMRSALKCEFQQSGDNVELAIKNFLLSLPLAVKCSNRIWLSHSLPADRSAENFDTNIFQKPLEVADLIKPGSAYLLTWGRNHSPRLLDKMAKLLDVDIFILGHQPQPQGWQRFGQNLIIIASDHDHGCLLPIDLAKSYTIDQLADSVIPLASIIA